MVEAMMIQANGLAHRALVWTPPPATSTPRATVVLVHGFMDAAGTWDRVAPELAAAGLRVVAPDMRGFGEGARAPRGSYYHFADYVFDLADLVDAVSPRAPVLLVGHSMGGTITTLFAGAFPERVARLATLEGLGPPDSGWETGPVRMRSWIEQVRRVRAREDEGRAAVFTREEARRRLAQNHPNVPAEMIEHCLSHLVGDAGAGDGVVWRFDPLHKTLSPVPFFARLFVEFANKVTCPVLFVSGGPRGFHPPDEDERLDAFADLERREIDDAGHMMHWTRPEEVARMLVAFFA